MDHLLGIALILGLVEGLTEFLPISSTGHLILVSDLLGFNDEKGKVFTVAIQTGAILAVVWDYRVLLWSILRDLPTEPKARQFVYNLVLAFIPIALLGLLLGSVIKAHLFAPVPVAMAFIIGGLIIFWAERRPHAIRIQTVEELGWQDALKLGLAQCFALIPGTSRSGATIVGGLLLGLSRKAAAEFSFFLAIPTLGMATLYDLYKHRDLLTWDDVPMFAVGFVAAFISAAFAVRVFIRYVSTHDFTIFVIYRIIFGIVILWTAYIGVLSF